MNDPEEEQLLTVRQARAEDGPEVRGFDAPDGERDADLVELAYYREPGRGAWVAERPDGRVVGCAALDRGERELALLRRLAGRGLPALTRAAVAFAIGRGYGGIEIVLPTAMADARRAVESEGFAPSGPQNDLLFRRSL